MEYLQKLLLIWQKIGLVQRVLLAAIVLATGLIGALLVHWAQKPDMRMLYQELSPTEAAKITEKIAGKEIAYELRDGGTTIYVPREYVYQLRLDLAKDGLPVAEQNGYKLFDDEKIGISPFVQNVNLKRALQDELAKSIQMIDGVAHARVHIVSPEQKLFVSDEEQTSASVVLKLRPGYRLSGVNIAAITHLVAGSVKGLKAESVTIIDSDGRLLSGKGDSTLASGASTAQDYKERVEQGLVRKAEDMLSMVLGPGRATVQVSAVIDMNSVNTITETYDPTGKVATKEEITSKSELGAAAAGQKTSPGATKKDETTTTEYQVGKTVKQHSVLPGEIRSMSVAAFVDLSVDANEPGRSSQSAAAMTVADVEEIIRTALGLKETDSIKVVNARFHRSPAALIEEESSPWPWYVALARQLSLGIMAICAVVVLRIFSRARGKAAAQGELPSGGASAGALMSGEPTVAEPLLVRRQIAHALKQNPDQVRQMFLSWIEERE
ncbi:MAG: flagellar M-ring protein FliF [Phycisphaerae bacterium]|nr:flagellar M-ring protein FliF [Phycisphaerae bacterium]